MELTLTGTPKVLPHDFRFKDRLTVEAWVENPLDRPETLQALVSVWSPLTSFDTFDAYDASRVDGLTTKGYFANIFDGRYVYFVPEQYDTLETHGVVLRYDTHGDFHDPASYAAYDAGRTAGMETRGYYGAAFDGRHVYFVPRQIDRQEYHTRLLRLDTRKEFKDPGAWDAFDIGPKQSAQGAAFDGRYLYLCPGYSGDPHKENELCSRVIRYDTQSDFKSRNSYAAFDVSGVGGLKANCFDGGAFDGRYIYFVPLQGGIVVRYDTRRPFTDAQSWQAFNAQCIKMDMCVGAVFDGRFLYFAPYLHGTVIRYDTTGEFTDRSSWSAFDAARSVGLERYGADGGFFDGRFITFIPLAAWSKNRAAISHARYLRYDTQGEFEDSSSWAVHDASATAGVRTGGYNAGTFDGRFYYGAPWRHGPGRGPGPDVGVHGVIQRYDTLGANGLFSLRYCDYGHNGGLSAAVPGPSFLVNTDRHVLSVAAYQCLPPGRHYLAGVYDGQEIKLFVDGRLAAARAGSGRLPQCRLPLTLGRIQAGLGHFPGTIHEVQIADRARSDAEIEAAYRQLRKRNAAKQNLAPAYRLPCDSCHGFGRRHPDEMDGKIKGGGFA